MMNNFTQAILNSWLSGATNAANFKRKKISYSIATCPDSQCGTLMYFPTHEASVECTGCGQRHTTATLSDRRALGDKEDQFQRSLTEIKTLYGGKKTAELVKVKGISNYQCKLLSPFLTTHGKDKNDKPRLLKDLGHGDVFDCSKLGGRSFAIEENLLQTTGYGQDKSGSQKYLAETLAQLSEANEGQQCLVPVHADGDGHCLVHAISRCLVGRELFWHALRTNMMTHLQCHRDKYAAMLKDFYEEDEWPEIISEAGPDYHPPEGQSLGLRTVHIFALANVLRRPIVLLDSIAGMQSKGDYSGIFLPSLNPPSECCTQGVLNSPIVIAWSNSGYNHFIPLVPIKDKPLPKLPLHLRPKVWGVDEALLSEYIEVESDGSIILARGKPLQDTYLQKLVQCMESLFFEQYGVLPSVVADVNQHVYRSAGCVGVSLDTVTMETKLATEQCRLFRCLICAGISCIPEDWVCQGGLLYSVAAGEYKLEDGQKYTFPRYGISAEYKAEQNILIPFDVNCFHCGQASRRLCGDGNIQYENGDRTSTRADPKYSKCCGYKHYWDGKEYDNLPEIIQFQLAWKGRQKTVKIHWFQNECDPSLNSNMYDVAYKTVATYFPGEFGSEQLVQRVIDMIISATEKKETDQVESAVHHAQTSDDNPPPMETDNQSITKTIVTGMGSKTKTLHKEELGISETERGIKRRVEQKLQKMKQESSPQQPRTDPAVLRTGRKTSPSPSSRDQPSSSPPAKISATERCGSPSATTTNTTSKPSPPSPSTLNANKRIRVTSSEGKNANLTLTPSATFTDLQIMIEQELGIPPLEQKLRWGFPPKELCPSEDPSSPLALSHGERVSVERIASVTSNESPERSPKTKPREGALSSAADDIRSLLMSDTFNELQHFPHLFKKGGYCFDELVRSYGNQLKDNMHVQFAEMPDIVFRYNATEECLEICLGIEHVPVGYLTREQREAAKMAASQSKEKDVQTHGSHHHSDTIEPKWLINRPGGSNIKAFSGTGHTLGGNKGGGDTDSQTKGQIEASYDSLLQAAQLIVATRLSELKKRELQLQSEVRTLNQQLREADAAKETESVEDNKLTTLERTLLDKSSELKQVREEMKELSSI